MGRTAIRQAVAADADFLTDMLVAAANWLIRDRSRADVLADPASAHYLTGWPRPTDLGVVATDDGDRPVGAAWLRFFTEADPGYGFVGRDVPELSIGVLSAWRGQGVGRALLRALAATAREADMTHLSLSVERANPAARLYRAEGYQVVESGPHSDTMLLDLRQHGGLS